jgi:hypothetical protein
MRAVHTKKLDELKRLQDEAEASKTEINRLNGVIRGLASQAAQLTKKLSNGHAKK